MRKASGMLAFFVLTTVMVIAQQTTTSLIGTVSTADGVLPGAQVLVRDNKTSREIRVITDTDGGFRVPNLEIGSYNVTISAAGFKTATAENVLLQVGRDYNLQTQLEVGGVSEVVTVTAGADIVNSTDAQQVRTISNRAIEDLPLLTRDPLGFLPAQAGVASNPNQQSTINGIRTSATNITIEGVNVQDNYIRANATDFSPARPLVDEVEEFNIIGQANVDKGFGAGQVQFPIRRGGNEYHGSLFAYNRNSRFGANSFFNNTNGVPKPFRNRNDFGGRIGGPLPFLNVGDDGPRYLSGKDRLFFFFFYQKSIDIVPAVDTSTTLLPGARNGLFTYNAAANDPANGVVAGQLVSVNILNPTFGTGITSVNPLIQSRFLANLPQGNSTLVGDQRNTTGFRFNQSNNREQTNYAARVDLLVNDKNSIKGIYRYVYQTVKRADIDNAFNAIPVVDQPSTNPFLSLGWVSSFSSNFTNELSGGFSFSDPVFLRNQAAPSAFVIPTLITNPEVTFLNQGRTSKAINLQDNATYTTGNHSILFGGQYQAIRINAFNDAGIVPTYSLGVNTNTPQISTAQFTNTTLFPGGVPTSQRAGANSLLALLGGIVGSGTQTFNVTSQTSGFTPGASEARRFETEIYGLYASDQWRVRKDLTLNIGLRYDIYAALRNPEGLFFEPVIPDGSDPMAAVLNPNGGYRFVGGNAGNDGAFFKTDYNNFGPNVSFAYAPVMEKGFGKFLLGGRTIIRGGYRISYINDEFVASANNAGSGNAGLRTTQGAINPVTGTTTLNSRINSLPGVVPPPFLASRTFANNNTAAFNFFGTVFGIDPEIQTPRIQEYSLGVQREIGFNSVIEVRYVGTRSNNLVRAIDFNQIDIRDNGFNADFLRARSNFLLTGNAACASAGCQPLTVFPRLASGGLLTNATVTGQLVAGTPADLALIYIQNGLTGTVPFLANPNTGVADLVGNFGKFNYNSMQVELRRRFSQGFLLNANYTFAKNLTNSQGTQSNAPGDAQTRFDPLLDNRNPELEYSRAISDQTHKFNLSAIYELPFGKGRRFFNDGALADAVLGGFTLSGILQIGSGSPITFTDVRGTLNRAGRSGRQTALSNLTKKELKALVGIYRTPNGIFFLPPAVLGRNSDGTLMTGRDGRGVSGEYDQAPFAGQVFFRNAPGSTSGLERSIVNGPTYYTLNLSLIKRFAIGESRSIQLQADAFNVMNTTNFIPAQSLDINSVNFGRITSSFDPRVMQFSARFNF